VESEPKGSRQFGRRLMDNWYFRALLIVLAVGLPLLFYLIYVGGDTPVVRVVTVSSVQSCNGDDCWSVVTTNGEAIPLSTRGIVDDATADRSSSRSLTAKQAAARLRAGATYRITIAGITPYRGIVKFHLP
jgi:hypothetical protein